MHLVDNKFMDYIRQPTTLLGIGLTICAFVGRILKALPEDICLTILSTSLPLWISEKKNQLQVGMVESAILHDIGREVDDKV